ncbi:MAG TPA: GNAT family N-acetyltransferase [Acidimicrobiales bacterium]|nr:GNAT family N-acetyltransferase [Acidimicrobiales bacterium]
MVDERLTAHLRSWLGAWPPGGRLVVTTSAARTAPGWDGRVTPTAGVASPGEGVVLSVPPDRIDAVVALGAADLEGLRVESEGGRLGEALGRPGARLFEGVFRWSGAPAPLDDAGEWVATDDPRVPPWLLPFGGDVLMAFDPVTGAYVAGVGIKRHDEHGHELAVVTEEAAQGRGLARRLVAQAARRVLADGAVPTYLHADANVRSAKVADAAGFPDLGWRILGIRAGS